MSRAAAGRPSRGSAGDEDVDALVSAILAASWVMVGISSKSVAAVNDSVTLTQFRTLAVLSQHGEMNLSRLAGELGVNASTAMRMIDRLIAAGFASRTENPASRREVLLALTPAGTALVAEVVAGRRKLVGQVVTTMPEDCRKTLVEALHTFTASAADITPHANPGTLGW